MTKINWKLIMWLATAFYVIWTGGPQEWVNHIHGPRPCNPLVLASCEP